MKRILLIIGIFIISLPACYPASTPSISPTSTNTLLPTETPTLTLTPTPEVDKEDIHLAKEYGFEAKRDSERLIWIDEKGVEVGEYVKTEKGEFLVVNVVGQLKEITAGQQFVIVVGEDEVKSSFEVDIDKNLSMHPSRGEAVVDLGYKTVSGYEAAARLRDGEWRVFWDKVEICTDPLVFDKMPRVKSEDLPIMEETEWFFVDPFPESDVPVPVQDWRMLGTSTGVFYHLEDVETYYFYDHPGEFPIQPKFFWVLEEDLDWQIEEPYLIISWLAKGLIENPELIKGNPLADHRIFRMMGPLNKLPGIYKGLVIDLATFPVFRLQIDKECNDLLPKNRPVCLINLSSEGSDGGSDDRKAELEAKQLNWINTNLLPDFKGVYFSISGATHIPD